MANAQGKALFGTIDNMAIRQAKTGSEYVRATLVSTRKDGSVAFKTDIVAFAPKKEGAKDPVAALKALGNGSTVRVYGFMEDVDQGGKYTKQMMRVIDARELNKSNDDAPKASEETAADPVQTNEENVEVPF